VRGDYDLCLGNNGVNFFKGRLDEFRIWKVARTQAEIQAHMNHPLLGTEPNLVAYWPFDELAPGTATGKPNRFGKHRYFDRWPGLASAKRPTPETLSAPESVSGLARANPDFRDAVPGIGFQLLSATNLAGPWGPIASAPAVLATNEVVKPQLP